MEIILTVLLCVMSLLCVFLVGFMVSLSKSFSKERNDYINRIMAKNTNEYIRLKKEEEKVSKEDILGEDAYGVNEPYNGILN